MGKNLGILVVSMGLLLAGTPMAAHHAFAPEFDVNDPVRVEGTVVKLDMVNPHSWLYVDATEPDGTVTHWRFEMGSPNSLFRLGWKRDTVPAGIGVVVTGLPCQGRRAGGKRPLGDIGQRARTAERRVESRTIVAPLQGRSNSDFQRAA